MTRLPRLSSGPRYSSSLALARAAVVILLVMPGSPLLAQTSSGPITLQSLSVRIDELEKRVAADEARGTNIPQQASDGGSSSSAKPTSTAPAAADQALVQRVSALEQQVTELRAELSQAGGSSTGGSASARPRGGGTTLRAPFTVVDASGKPVLTVGSLKDGVVVHALDEATVRIGSNSRGATRVGLFAPGSPEYASAQMVLGSDYSGEVFAEDTNAHATAALFVRDGNAHVQVEGSTGHALAELTAVDQQGALYVWRPGGKDAVASLIGNQNGAELMLLGSGDNIFAAGMSDDDSSAYAEIESATGSAYIGAEKDFGVRIYGADGKTATAGMVEDAQGNASVQLAQKGVPRVSLAVGGASGIVGVLDGTGKKFLAALTNYPGGGGALQVAAPSGQIVAQVDANPVNNLGRAVFTDGGGNPLAKIGAAGSHGDVLLSGNGKAFQLWAKMIAGLP